VSKDTPTSWAFKSGQRRDATFVLTAGSRGHGRGTVVAELRFNDAVARLEPNAPPPPKVPVVWWRALPRTGPRLENDAATMNRQGARWTDAEDAKLRALAGSGAHARSIALKLRRTESSIKARVRAIGMTLRPPPKTRFRFDRPANDFFRTGG
jgi:hypothetical protein